MKNLITVLFFFLSAIFLYGQDPVFSQFNLSPLNLNPAMTGGG